VMPENDLPDLIGLDSQVIFAENTVNTAPQLIDTSITFTDPDNNFAGGMLTVSGLLAEDAVSILNAGTGVGEIGFDGSTITFGGTTIGTASGGNGTDLSVAFNSSATTESIDALLQNLTYRTSSDTPTADRTLTISVTDGFGQADLISRTGAANPFDGVDVGIFSAPSFADIDNDGDLDAFVGENDGTINFFENIGTAAAPVFALQVDAANPFDGVNVSNRSSAPALVDIDNDGDLDAFIGSAAGTLRFFENTGTAALPRFIERSGSANPFDGVDVGFFSPPAFADIDNDGDLDVVIGVNTGILNYFENTGTANKPSFVERTGAANPFAGIDVGLDSVPTFVDLDNDGDLDIFVGEKNGTIRFFENTGSATTPVFTARFGAANALNGVDVDRDSAPTFVDIDGDGDFDAFIGDNNGNLNFFENIALVGGDSASQQVQINVTAENDAPVAVDDSFTGDIDAFVAVLNDSSFVALNDGEGSFSDSGQLLSTNRAGNVALGDFDGDGDDDAFIQSANVNSNSIWFNDGSGVFTDSGQVLSNMFLGGIELGDLDGDGDLDAFVGNHDASSSQVTEENTVWLNDGSGTFIDSGQRLGAGGTFDVALGDLDGDGDLDAYVANGNFGSLTSFDTVWLNDGSGNFVDSGQQLGSVFSTAVVLGTWTAMVIWTQLLLELGSHPRSSISTMGAGILPSAAVLSAEMPPTIWRSVISMVMATLISSLPMGAIPIGSSLMMARAILPILVSHLATNEATQSLWRTSIAMAISMPTLQLPSLWI